jgi:hypothetical protein
MSMLRRVVVGFVVLGFLLSGAALTFQIARSRPRCVFTGPYSVERVSADGSRLVTRGYRPNGRPNAVQVWDAHRGKLIHQIDDEAEIWDLVFSQDGRYAALGVGRVPVLIECETGAEWRFDELADYGIDRFSPKGSWLLVTKTEASYCIDVARHGTVPLPNEQLVCFNANEQPVFVTRAGAPELFVWDLHRREKVAVAPWTSDPELPETSSNRALAAQITRELSCPDCDTFNYQIDVWDLATLERRIQRRLSIPVSKWVEFKFSPGGQTAAILVNEQQIHGLLETQVQFLDMMTDTSLGTAKCNGEFSPDGLLWHSLVPIDQDRNALRVFDVPTGRALWERPAGRVWEFLGTTGTVLYQYDPEQPLQLLDARTGNVRAAIRFGAIVFPEPTTDGRRFQVYGALHVDGEQPPWKAWLADLRPDIFGFQFPDEPFVAVFESASGRELLWVRNHGGAREMLSDDGSTLTTVDQANDDEGGTVIRVWDVLPTKAYRSAVVAAAALGVALLGLRWTWRKWKGRVEAHRRQTHNLNRNDSASRGA